MKRAMIMGVLLAVAGTIGVGALYGREYLDGMRFETAMSELGKTETANAGPWPQPEETCFFCHGTHGQSRNAWYPALTGQPEAYVVVQLHAFANGGRHNPYMAPLAKALTDGQIKALADYFARQAPTRNEAVHVDAALQQRVQSLIQTRSCQACHGAALTGKDQVPRLSGQGEAYLASQLAAFKTGQRHDPSGAMNGVAATLSDEEIRALASYLASIEPGQRIAGSQ
jgi:cytochrome c553